MAPTNSGFQHADAWEVATSGNRGTHFGAYAACTVIDRRAQLYLTAERAGMGFNLARVPADFDLEPNELFDPEYMRALFERGVAAGLDEASWIRQGH
ncbi:MAG: Patatin [Pseudomonadota bacterium]|nr:Patatin [Pseudomonadota bacterium]